MVRHLPPLSAFAHRRHRLTGAGRGRQKIALLSGVAAVCLWPLQAGAEDPFTAPLAPSHNLYGMPGLIDMPTADMSPDAQLTTTVGHFAGTTRASLSFQILPRLTGSFRYSALEGYVPDNYDLSTYYDRSFDLRYQLVEEGDLRPAIAVGLRDFIGTGLYGGEYIVATKGIGDKLRVTAGLGWGRLGSQGAIGSTGTRPSELLGEGGIPTYDRWFRGDVAPFGGISYQVTERLAVSAEYSSDAYEPERGISPISEYGNTEPALFDRKSSLNFGIDYRFKNGNQLSVYSLYGDTIGAQLTLSTNPRYANAPTGLEKAPAPIIPRQRASLNDLGWSTDDTQINSTKRTLRAALEGDGLAYQNLRLSPREATLQIRNPRYSAEPQAIGRAARHMARVLPASVEVFHIIPTSKGMPLANITVKRSDLEALEHAPAEALLERVAVTDAAGLGLGQEAGLPARSSLSLAPYLTFSVFDPDNPVRIDTGLRLSGSYFVTPGLELSGSVTHKLAGNLDSVTREIPSNLPRVRTDYAEYSRQGDTAIEHLTLSHFGRPGKDLYSRVTAGYLETMYAGISGEILWKPVDNRLALGAEVNHVKQRDFDQKFGLREYETTTGHLSAYYDFGNGFHGQVDAGRYLAGDIGATFSLDREFANGWRIGAYATFTDVSAEEYGEGSFDKGIRLTIPMSWALGKPSRRDNTVTLQSLTRDGGARVNVRDRLYQRVRDYHQPELNKEWGRVWR